MSRSFCAAALVLFALVAGSAPRVATAQPAPWRPSPVRYLVPVEAVVVDTFRPPSHVGAPGNRGLEYASNPSDVVSAAAAGRVLFAGAVAGRNAVTIQHEDGVRTTYTGMSEVWVVLEQDVRQSSAIGLASGRLHFGALIRNHYLDPQILIDASENVGPPRLLPPPVRPG